MLPLEGIRVISLEHAVAAPLCTRHMADLGAEVIKVERPGEGDFARGYDTSVKGQSSFFIWLNRGKRSITLDLKNPAAADILDRLIAQADVLVQNLAPGAAGRIGLGYPELAPNYPGLVVTDISGYGESGPYAQKKAYDLLVQAESGIITVTGTPEEPARVGISIVDIATGMYALSGTLAALLRRAKTGRGANVKIAMLDAIAEWMTYPLYQGAYAGAAPKRLATSHPAVAPYGPHATKDGQVIFGLQNDREWTAFCVKVLRQPGLVQDPRFATNTARCAHRAEVTSIIESFFAGYSSAEVVSLLDAAGIASGRLNDVHAVWRHAQFAVRGRWRDVATPAGPVRALLPPFTFGDADPVMGAVPGLGQHTDTILRQMGYSQAEIAQLHEVGAV
ncbi:MAG: CoA transferase [Acetobacteraceae bacterium]|nr:CoA transferase [Acetobacteraceae bacterium]